MKCKDCKVSKFLHLKKMKCKDCKVSKFLHLKKNEM